MLYQCVNEQDYRTEIKSQDIQFRKAGNFKYLELTIPENDCGSEIKEIQAGWSGWGKDYFKNT